MIKVNCSSLFVVVRVDQLIKVNFIGGSIFDTQQADEYMLVKLKINKPVCSQTSRNAGFLDLIFSS